MTKKRILKKQVVDPYHFFDVTGKFPQGNENMRWVAKRRKSK